MYLAFMTRPFNRRVPRIVFVDIQMAYLVHVSNNPEPPRVMHLYKTAAGVPKVSLAWAVS